MSGFLMTLMLLTSVFMITLILIQRGKGGGLAGAFGGMGGQSAFGAKAGDMMTRVTIGVAIFWILLCILTVRYVSNQSIVNVGGGAPPATTTGTPAEGTGTGAAGDSATGEGAGAGAAGASDAGTSDSTETTGSGGASAAEVPEDSE